MAKKIWEQLQEEEQQYKEYAKQKQQETQQKFEEIAAKNKNKQLSTIGSIQNAYKGLPQYETVKNSLNNYYNNQKKDKPNIWDKIKYIAKSFGTGATQGTMGVAQGSFTDISNEMQKGKQKGKYETLNNLGNAIASNDLYFGAKSAVDMVNDDINIIKDKDKNLWQKIVGMELNLINTSKYFVPGYGRISGLAQTMGKIGKENNINTEEPLLKANQDMQNIIDKKQAKLQEEGENYNGLTRTLGSATQSIGNMTPSIVASAVTKNPNIGLGIMGASVKGQATNEALKKGKDLNKATQIGDAKALIEVLTEKISGGAKVFGKGSLDDIAEDFIKNRAKSKFGKFLMKQGYNTLGEITEEEISNVVDNIIDKGTTDPNKKIIDLKEAGETAGQTALTTTLLNVLTGGMVGDYRDAKYQTQQEQNAQNWVNKAQDIINQETNQQQNQNALETNVARENKQLNLENNQDTLYNNSNEMESDINGQIQSGRVAGISGQLNTSVQQDSEQQQNRKYTRKEYEQWENNITPTEEGKLTNEQRKLRDEIKRQYNKDIVFFDGNNNYNAGASLSDKNKIYVRSSQLEDFGYNKIALHEVAESNIRFNREISNDIIQPAIEKIINDPKFEEQKRIFWENQEGDMPSDYAIAKDILCDRFSEIQSKENLDYKNILSQETNMTIDYALDSFNNEIKNNTQLPIKQRPNLPSKGEEVNYTEMERPEGKIRKHYRSIIESSNTTPEAKKIAKELMGSDTYIPESNKSQIERADNFIEEFGVEKAVDRLMTNVATGDITYDKPFRKKVGVDDIALGERLIQYFSKTGDATNLQNVIQATAMAGTEAGRAVQIMSLINHQTPTGQVTWMQRNVDKVNKELQQKYKNKKNVPQFDFTAEMQQKILNSENQEQMYKNISEVYQELGQQVPKTFSEKIDEWRYFSMLANLKTHGRNIIGNTAMNITQRTKNKVAGAIEGTIAKFNPDMERTHTLRRTSKEVKEFAKNDIKNIGVQSSLGMNENKYNPQSRLQNARKTFKTETLNKTVGKLFDINSTALEVEDNIGLKAMYVNALGEYITANKIDINNITDKQLSKARQHAIKEAQEATFHQASALATALNQMGKRNNIVKFALDAAVPFKKTPINVAKTGVQYSPVGLMKSAIFDVGKVRRGDISVNQYIDNVSKGLTGTGIAFMGFVLGQAGILKASGGDDDKKEKYDEEQGKQTYSITIGGRTASLDWLSPVGIPLFMGAEINKQFNSSKKEKNSKSSDDEKTLNKIIRRVSDIGTGFSNAINPMSEMSMVSGLTSVLSSYNRENAVGDMIVNAGTSYINQFVPTALSQIARTTDEYERTTKSTKTGTLPKAIDRTMNQVRSKIPGLRQTLPTKADIWGKDVKQSANLPIRALNNFINPSNIKEISKDEVDKELNSLYSKTGEKSIIPKSIEKKYTIDGTNYIMTDEEYAKYNKKYGETSYKLINDLIKSKDYAKLSDTQKQKAIENIYKYAQEQNKINYAVDNKLKVEQSTLYKTLTQLKNNGGNQSAYLEYIGKIDGIKGEGESKKKIGILADSNYSDKTKEIIYKNTEGSQDSKVELLVDKLGFPIQQYLKYRQQEFENDKNEYGETISGTKKQKVLNYLDSISDKELPQEYKKIICQMENNSTYAEDVARFVNSSNKLTSDEKIQLLKKMNFEVDRYGNIKNKIMLPISKNIK